MNHTPQAEYAIFERIAQLEEQLASWQQHCEENQRLLQAERAKREEMEQAMYRSETLFRELIQHNRDPIIVIHDDIIRSVNAAAEALLERKSDELVGENIGLLMAAGSTEVDILGKRGTHTIADMQVVDIEWEGDRVSLASLRDITDYKRMAEELQRSHDELEQRVLERTSELAAANQALQAEIAEHERTEQALRESEERFRTISELVSDFAYSLSIEPGGKPVLEWITDAFTTITGFTAQEVEAQGGWYSLTYQDDQTVVKQHHDWMLAGFQSDEYEFRILTRQGNIRWLRNHCRGLWDEQEQRVVRIYGGVKDITEWKQAMEAVRESEQKFHCFFEQSNDSLVLMNDHGYIIECNHRTQQLLGQQQFEVAGLPLWDVLFQASPVSQRTEDYAQQVKNNISTILNGEHAPSDMCLLQEVRHANGTHRFLDVLVFPIQVEKGKLAGAIIRDITEQKRSEESLRESEEWFRTIANFTHDWEYWLAPDGSYLYVSPACERITGYPPEAFYADKDLFVRIVHPLDRAKMTSHIQHELAESKAEKQEFRIITSNGEERWIGHVCLPVYSKTGEWLGRRGSNRDITDQKWTEEAYRILVDHSLQGLAILQENRVRFANSMMANITGYSVQELLDSSPEDIYTRIHPDDRERVMSYLHERLEGRGSPTRYELRTVRKDGDIRWVEVYAVLTYYQGKPASQVAYVDISERKQAEQALENSRALLQAILDSTTVGIAVIRKNHGIVNANQRFQQIWDLPDNWWHLPSWKERSAVMVERIKYPWEFVQHAQELSISAHETRNTIAFTDGRYIERYGSPYRVDNQIVGQVWSFLDVTEQVRAEQALRESEARYRSLAHNFPNGLVLLFDRDMRFLVAGGEKLEAIGLSPDMLEGKTFQEVVPIDIGDIGEPLYRAILDGTAPAEIEQHYAGRVYHTQPVSLRNDQDEIVAGMIISQDITERKQLESVLEERVEERTRQLFTVVEELHAEMGHREHINRELQRSRDLLRIIFDSIGDGLVLLNDDGRVLAANQPMANLVGHETSDALLNMSWADLCRECGQDEPAEDEEESGFPGMWVLDVLHDEQSHRRREEFVRADGTFHVLDMQTLPIAYASTSIDQMILHIVDVTEQVQLEQLQLENERLTTIRKISQIVAHEVNTPLQTILNALEGLELANTSYRKRFLALAQQEIERVGAILHRLKDPLQSSTEPTKDVDMRDLLDRVLTLTEATLKKHAIVLQQDIPASMPLLHANPDQLTQVLLNLFLNAIDAMPEGGVLGVSIQVPDHQSKVLGNSTGEYAWVRKDEKADMPYPLTTLAPESALIIEVSDTGIGIDASLHAQIFESFFTTKEMGTGLGLAVSQKIINEHGGTINVRSTPGEGSAFVVMLPVPDNVSSTNL